MTFFHIKTTFNKYPFAPVCVCVREKKKNTHLYHYFHDDDKRPLFSLVFFLILFLTEKGEKKERGVLYKWKDGFWEREK
jgi:hypothetical protein